MGPDSQRLTASERANLVAYLDGELGEEQSQALAAKLTHSISARRETETLERTWELLDFLPRPEGSPDLTARTLSLALGAGTLDDRLVRVAGRTTRVLGRVVLGAAVASVGAGAGFAAVRWAWPDPTARLARDLSLAEHLDAYREVDSFDFLNQLDLSTPFGQDIR